MTERSMEPLTICDTNISRAWSRALLHVLDHPGKEISPLVVSLGSSISDEQKEDAGVRGALDAVLSQMDAWDVETVGFTIFPQRYWNLAQGDRSKLFAFCTDAVPRIKEMNQRNNRRGLYFERLMMYGRGPCNGNQLEWIISQFSGRPGVRRSMFQASIFDPERDHVPDAQLGFPCLQHVSFIPTSTGLVLNAFYATQQLLDKAYGNYLGLYHLGQFMAREMKQSFASLNVYVGVAKLERTTKSNPAMKDLIAAARACANTIGERPVAA